MSLSLSLLIVSHTHSLGCLCLYLSVVCECSLGLPRIPPREYFQMVCVPLGSYSLPESHPRPPPNSLTNAEKLGYFVYFGAVAIKRKDLRNENAASGLKDGSILMPTHLMRVSFQVASINLHNTVTARENIVCVLQKCIHSTHHRLWITKMKAYSSPVARIRNSMPEMPPINHETLNQTEAIQIIRALLTHYRRAMRCCWIIDYSLNKHIGKERSRIIQLMRV